MKKSEKKWMNLMKKLSLSLFSLAILFFFTNLSLSKEEKIISGKASVVDGDTIKINEIPIRLYGIDAPEKNQICIGLSGESYNCGLSSTRFLKVLINNSTKVECSYTNLDRYGRIIGKCISYTKIENKKDEPFPLSLNYWMVVSGHAVEYKRYSRGEYSKAEKTAKKEKKGLWKGEFDRPEKWRRKYK